MQNNTINSIPAKSIMPSILSADYANLAKDVVLFEDTIERIHLDVMDGHFVNNITFGPSVIKAIRQHSKLFFDAHLMISNPKEYIEAFTQAGVDSITFHIEVGDTQELIDLVKKQNIKVGISLNPATDITTVLPFLDQIDSVLVMSVVPGWGGQPFMEEVLDKVVEVKKHNSNVLVTVDGGINQDSIKLAASAGVDYFVAGSAIYGTQDPVATAINFQSIVDQIRGG